MKRTVIYHSADFDGIFCREIARTWLPGEDTTFVGWNFGDAPLPVPEGLVYVMDLPVTAVFGAQAIRFREDWITRGTSPPAYELQFSSGRQAFIDVVWIDHHKSSIEDHPEDLPGYRIDGVAACRLAWQWFWHWARDARTERLPAKESYLSRKVIEPLAVRWAGEYDVWDKRDPDSETFQFGLRTAERIRWEDLLGDDLQFGAHYARKIMLQGQPVQRYQQEIDAQLVSSRSFLLNWEGLKWLVLNTARCNSLTFAAKDVPETGHDALLGYYCKGDRWVVSLYHARHRTDLDLSEIAKRHGGGGHRGACGFTCQGLPFEGERVKAITEAKK